MVLKALLLITSILMSFHLKADCLKVGDDYVFCRGEDSHFLDDYEDLLDWWSASPKQIREAKCNNSAPITLDEIRNYLDSKNTGIKISTGPAPSNWRLLGC